MQADFERLVAGEIVRVPVNAQASFFELQQSAALWGLFLSSGYFTMAKAYQPRALMTPVRIPNDELMISFREIVSRYGGFADNVLEALAQMHERQYYAGLRGEVLLLGIAHDKKACAMASETILL